MYVCTPPAHLRPEHEFEHQKVFGMMESLEKSQSVDFFDLRKIYFVGKDTAAVVETSLAPKLHNPLLDLVSIHLVVVCVLLLEEYTTSMFR